MASQPRATEPRADGDGVRREVTAGVRRDVWLVVGLGVAVLGLALGLRATLRGAPGAAPGPLAADRVPSSAAPAAPSAAAPGPAVVPPAATGSPAAAAAARAERRRARDDARAEARKPTYTITAEPSGMALFPPPGTKPVKRGLVVPESFALPEGYVRHYQATDDGEMLPPILMFSPDFDWVDASGRPLQIPADGVVPPELAPPGLPIQVLEVPERKGAAD